MSPEELQEFCDDRNSFAREHRKDEWHRVIRRNVGGGTRYEIQRLTGYRAIEERTRADGKLVEWFKGDPDEIAAIHAHAAACSKGGGITQAEFNERADRGDFRHVGRALA